jgi:AraC-like DNA-binding protein
MRPLLERLRIHCSRDIEETRAFLHARSIRLDLGPDQSAFEIRYNGLYMPTLWLGYMGYGSAVTSRYSPVRGDCWIQLPLHGSFESSLGRERRLCNPRVGVITPAGEPHIMRSEANTARLGMAIDGGALMAQLAVLLDEPPVAPLRFEPEISFERGFGRSLARIVRCVVHELETCDDLRDPQLAKRFAEFVMTGLLLSHPHNYSDALRRRERPIAPRDVRRALDYIHDHLGEDITLADLVRASGVPGRTLLQHFRDFKGVSPMRYVRNARLQRVREDLRAGRFACVGEAAARWQFTHAGRFSAEYRRRFGENPSQTFAHMQIPPADA